MIEVISEENYNSFMGIIKQIRLQEIKGRIVLFGAGTMGKQFLCLLRDSFGEQNEVQILFCDNNRRKWGRKLEETLIISPDDLQNGDLIIVTVERYESICLQLSHLVPEDMLYVLTNKDEFVCADNFYTKKMDADTLIIGDCELEKICYSDYKKKSISSLLMDNGNIKVVSCNGLYVRQQFEMVKMLIRKMGYLKRVFLLADIRNFHNSYHLYPKNQHVDLFTKIITDDTEGFLSTLRVRETATKLFENNIFDGDTLDEKECLLKQSMDMRAFYMFRMSETNESVKFLGHMSKELNRLGIRFRLVMLPINFERGMRLSAGAIQESLQKAVDILNKELKNNELVNLSNFVPERDYVGINTLGSGYLYRSRKRVAEEILKLL